MELRIRNVTTTQWLEIVRFELVYQFAQPSTWLFFAAFLLMLMGQTNGQVMNAQEGEIAFNAPVLIAETSVTITLAALLLIAAVAGDAATRDVQLRIEPLLHAAPIRRAAYLGGRFTGAFVVVALFMMAIPLAPLLATVVHPGLTAELTGPFRPVVYFQTYLLLVVPNVFVMTALLFSLATLVRHTMGSYLAAALVFAGTFFSRGFIGGKLGRWDLATMLDSTGVTAVHVMMKAWSPLDLNARMVGSEPALLWNRLLWIVVASSLLALTAARFRFGRKAGLAQRGSAIARESTHVRALHHYHAASSAGVRHPARRFGAAVRARQTLTIARDSLREMVTGWSWLVVPAMLLQVAMTSKMLGHLGTPHVPLTGRVLETFTGPLNTVFFFIVLFAGELVWRERDANIHGLTDTAPVPDPVRFAGKLLGLWTVIAALHAVLMLAGVLMQLQAGHHHFELSLYLRILFGMQLVEPLVFAMLALSVHVLVNHKHVGHLVMLLLVFARALLTSFGIEHPLAIYGSDPGWSYSPISGFGAFVAPFLWFELYWAAWTLLLAVIARLFWVRGVALGVADRVRIARRRFRGGTIAATAAALLLVLFTGGFVFYNTNVLNRYESSAESARHRAEYERRYRRHAFAPQPEVTATELFVELHPGRRAAEVRGVYQLTNRTQQPIDTIHVAVSDAVRTAELELGRAARVTLRDDELGQRVYVLSEALRPGESLRMSWRVQYEPRGFPAGSSSSDVVENGSFVVLQRWMPLIGYQPNRELTDAAQRKAHGLPERREVASLDDQRARHERRGHEETALRITVGTAADQTAVAPGALRRSWMSNGRRYFEYAPAAPIGAGYAIFSARYAVRKARAGDVALEVFHHPAHTLNVERMLRSMQVALAQYTRRFGPYRYEVLRMIEYPGQGGGLHAAHANIWYQELFSVFDSARHEERIDMPFGVVAHEVAHQFQTSPARVEGRGLLSESFAWYAAMGVIEQEYGSDHLQRFLRMMRRAYLDPRARAGVPLLRSSDWFESYRKGPFAMLALREYIGEAEVDLAWRRLIDKHRSGEPPYATSLDLLRELERVTPPPLRHLLIDLLERNTFWELKTRKATVQPAANGQWRVTLEVDARKVVVDEKGAETHVPMNDLIEIGVYAPADAVAAAEPSGVRGKTLYRAMHRVRSGVQTITLTVAQRPAHAGIDPRHLLIDVEPEDNVVETVR